MKGTVFAQAFVKAADQKARDALVLDAVIGDSWIRWPSTVINVQQGGRTIGFVVANDYFAIGEPDDFVRVPVSGPGAQALADKLGFILPTPRMVDLIWKAAPAKLRPIPANEIGVSLGQEQMSGAAAVKHSRAIDRMLPPGLELRAGQKKDIVIGNRLADPPVPLPGSVEHKAWNRDGVGIYGWHQAIGTDPKWCANPTLPGLCPIQGYSFAHFKMFADYSHGVRMVWLTAFVDGEPMPLRDVLTDPELSKALSHEGPLKVLRYGGPIVAGVPGSGGQWCQGLVGCALPPGDPGGGTVIVVGLAALAALGVGAWYGGYL